MVELSKPQIYLIHTRWLAQGGGALESTNLSNSITRCGDSLKVVELSKNEFNYRWWSTFIGRAITTQRANSKFELKKGWLKNQYAGPIRSCDSICSGFSLVAEPKPLIPPEPQPSNPRSPQCCKRWGTTLEMPWNSLSLLQEMPMWQAG